jgi:putative membrane protein insertion efficiency factor
MNIVQRTAIGVLRIYQVAVSPVLHTLVGPFGGCRFHPTCSVYAAEAVRQHGVAKGSVLAATRICRCHPWGECGEDPVPQRFAANRRATGARSCQPPGSATI